jgi:tetratricopeptide (TPR) repeat protein
MSTQETGSTPGGGDTPRAICDIYAELGRGLLGLARELRAAGQGSQAQRRFAEAAQAFQQATREGGNPGGYAKDLGYAWEAQRRYEDAIRVYLEAILADPPRTRGLLDAAQLCLTRERATTLGRWIIIDWKPKVLACTLDDASRSGVRQFLARVHLYLGEYDAAIEQYELVLQGEPDRRWLDLEGLGQALWQSGQPKAAVPRLEEAVRLSVRAKALDDSVRARAKLGAALIDAGKPCSALRELRYALSLVGVRSVELRAKLWAELGRCRLALGRGDGGMLAAQRAIALDDKLPTAHAVLAAALVERNDFQDAIESAEEALRIDPRNTLAIRAEGQALIESGDEQGIRLTAQYLDEVPDDTACRLFLADAMRRVGRPPRDIAAVLEPALGREAAPKPSELYLELARAYLDVGNADLALKTLAGYDRGPGRPNPVAFLKLKGDILRQMGDERGALGSYDGALALDPSDPAVLAARASLLTDAERFGEALDAWGQAIDASPRNGKLKLELAVACKRAGQPERSWSAVQEAMRTGVYEKDARDAALLRAELAEQLPRSPEEQIEAYYEAGRQLGFNDEHERAERFFHRVVEAVPGHAARWYEVDTLRLLAATSDYPYRDRVKLGKARVCWERALAQGVPDREDAWAYVGGMLVSEGLGFMTPAVGRALLMWESVAYLERSLVLDDANLYAWLSLTRAQRTLGNLGTALTAAEGAAAIDAENTAAIDEKLAVYADLGDAERAQKLIDERRARERNTWLNGVGAFVLLLRSHQSADDDQRVTEYRLQALDLLDGVIRDDPSDLWAYALRAECLRALALLQPEEDSDVDYRRRAIEDLEKICSKAEVADELTLANAEYGRGNGRRAIELVEPLLEHPADTSGESYRLTGCCHLRLGDLAEGERRLATGIDRATSTPQLYSLKLNLAEIRREASSPGLDLLLGRLSDRLDSALALLGSAKRSAESELRGILDGAWSSQDTRGWTQTGARAGLARLFLRDRRLDEAADCYRALLADPEFPEARAGLERVAAGWRKKGEKALRRGWGHPHASTRASEYFRKALDLLEREQHRERGDLLVCLGLAFVQAGDEARAGEHFASAIGSYESDAPDAQAGAQLGELCRHLLTDMNWFWALDRLFSALSGEPSASQTLREQLALARAALTPFLDAALGLTPEDDEASDTFPLVEPIVLEIADSLSPPEGAEEDWLVIKHWIPEMRERVEDETGVRVPRVLVRGNAGLADDTYVISLQENPIVQGSVVSRHRYSPSAAQALEAAGVPLDELTPADHPLSGRPGWWIPAEHWQRVQNCDTCLLWEDPMQFAIAHLEAVLRRNLADFAGIQEVSDLLGRWARSESDRALIATAIPDEPTRVGFVRLVRALLREGVPVVNMKRILEAVRESGLRGTEIGDALQHVRLAIREELPGNAPGVKSFALPGEIEDAVLPWITSADGRRFFAVPPEEAQALLTKTGNLIPTGEPALVLVTEREEARPAIRSLIALEFPGVMVQSRRETTDEEARGDLAGPEVVITEWRTIKAPGGEVASDD